MKTSIATIGSVLSALLGCCAASGVAQVNIVTNRYDQSRTAANLNETILTTANVNTSTFGKLGTYFVDGVVYAQPLYVQGVTVNGATHNVLYVATMHDVLYAFDADKVGSLPLWAVDFTNLAQRVSPAPVIVGAGDGSDPSVADTFGILGTPFIDLPNNRMFLVTHTLENGTECFRLRAVDIRSGALLNSILVTGTMAAAAGAAAVSFDPTHYGQRPALGYADGQVWVAFGSRPTGDELVPWYGWVMTYDPNTLTQTGVFATSRTNGNSIWESGGGPAVDAGGNVYYLTGNGGSYDGVTEFPESLLKLRYAGSLGLNDWYTPDNGDGVDDYLTLNQYDLDLAVNGPVLIPGTDLVVFGSKTADVYVLHTGNLGHLTPYDTQLAQFFHVGAPTDFRTTDSDRIVGMAFWPSASGGTLYVWPGLDSLHAYSLNGSTSTFTQSYAGTVDLHGQPATALALSANGTSSGTGILWAPVMNVAYEANTVGRPGILHAYNAENPAQELWNSNMVAADAMGTLPKFVPPVVANGKVYMANSAAVGNYGNGSVTVYGLKSNLSSHIPPVAGLTSPVIGATYTSGSTITLSASAYGKSSPLSSIAFMDGTSALVTLPAQANTNGYSYMWTSAATGSHTIAAVVTDSAGAVTVTPARTISVITDPTYTVSVAPASIVLAPGSTTTATITVAPLAGYSGPPSATVIGLKNGISGVLTQGDSDTVFVLTLSAPTNAAPQFVPLTIEVGAGGQPNSAYLPVTIARSAAVPGLNTFTVSLSSAATLGAPVVFTEGVPSSSLANPEFTLVPSGTTCTGAVSGSCHVQVQFTPQFAGLRRGAFDLVDSNNNVVLTYFFSGTGTGAEPTLADPSVPPSMASLYSPATGSPAAVAVDGAGNVFAVDAYSNQLLAISPGSPETVVPLGLSLKSPSGLALNAAGDLYIADTGNNRILRLPYGSSTATVLNITGLNQPQGLAIDGAGNLWIANSGASSTNGKGNILEWSPSGTQSTFVSSGLNSPSGVAVDAAGDVFVTDTKNNRVLEVQPGSTAVPLAGTYAAPAAVALDGVGDVLVTDQGSGRLLELLAGNNGPGTGGQMTLASGLPVPAGVTLNGSGNAFVADLGASGSPGNVLEFGILQSQTITLAPVPSLVVGGAPFPVSATASSGLPVTLAASPAAVCSLSNTQVTPVGVGTCTITATQPGNTIFAAAPPATTSFSVRGMQTINFPALPPEGLGGLPVNLGATATSGLPVAYTSGTPAVCTVSTTSVKSIATGTCMVTASQAGNNLWAPAPSQTQNIPVMPNLLINGGVEGQLSPWRFIVTSPGNGVASLGTAQFVDGASSADIQVTQTAAYSNRVDWEQDKLPLVAGTTYTVQFWAMADSAHPVDVRSEGPYPYPYYGLQTSFSVSTAWAQYTTNFTASATVSNARLEFHFAKALGNVWIDDVQLFASSGVPQSITWPQQPDVAYGAGPVTLRATASSGLTVAYTSNAPSVCTVSGLQATLVAPGSCSITATQPGNATYAPAAPVSQGFNVTQATQTISFAYIPTVAYGVAPFSIQATSSSGLPVSFASNAPAVCSVSGNTVTILAGGTCSITATQGGNTYYAAASPVAQSFTVTTPTQTQQTISFGAILTQGLGGLPFSVPATASSGLPVLLTSNSTAVCTVSATSVTLLSTGTCSITATQGGDSNYAPAAPVTQTFNVVPNMLANGGFETASLSPWLLTTSSTAVASAVATISVAADASYSAAVTVSQVGASYVDVDFWQTSLPFTSGKTYVVKFWARSSTARTLQMDAQTGSPDWTLLGLSKTVSVGTGWTQHSFTFIPTVSATKGRLEFHVGSAATTVWLDDVQLYQQD